MEFINIDRETTTTSTSKTKIKFPFGETIKWFINRVAREYNMVDKQWMLNTWNEKLDSMLNQTCKYITDKKPCTRTVMPGCDYCSNHKKTASLYRPPLPVLDEIDLNADYVSDLNDPMNNLMDNMDTTKRQCGFLIKTGQYKGFTCAQACDGDFCVKHLKSRELGKAAARSKRSNDEVDEEDEVEEPPAEKPKKKKRAIKNTAPVPSPVAPVPSPVAPVPSPVAPAAPAKPAKKVVSKVKPTSETMTVTPQSRKMFKSHNYLEDVRYHIYSNFIYDEERSSEEDELFFIRGKLFKVDGKPENSADQELPLEEKDLEQLDRWNFDYDSNLKKKKSTAKATAKKSTDILKNAKRALKECTVNDVDQSAEESVDSENESEEDLPAM